MVKPPSNWNKYQNAPADIKSKPNGNASLKCNHCGNNDINQFMRPIESTDLICLSCNKTVQ